MPVPTETLRKMKTVHIVFAATSLITLVTMIWMLWHDFDRKWRGMQTDFFNLRSAMAHFDALSFESPSEKEKRARLVEALEVANAALDDGPGKTKKDELEADVARLEGILQGASLAYGNLNAEIQVTAFDYEEHKTLHGADHPKTAAVLQKLEKETEDLARLKKDKDQLDDKLAAAKSDLKALYEQRDQAQKALNGYDKLREVAERNDRMFGPGIERAIFNMPGLDFLAPKATPGRQEIRQVFMPDIRFNFNYLDSYQTDRCITCHVGIDDPEMSEENFVRQGERAMQADAVTKVIRDKNVAIRTRLTASLAEVEPQIGNTELAQTDDAGRDRFIRDMVREANQYLDSVGRPPVEATARPKGKPTPPIAAALMSDSSLTRGKVTDAILERAQRILSVAKPKAPIGDKVLEYDDMDEAQRSEYVQSLLAALNDYLDDVGRPRIKLDKVLMVHPDLDLYVGPKSKHPMQVMGCTVCHHGSGQDTDFILAAHTPRSHDELERWEHEYGERELGFIKLSNFHTVEEYWEYPMYPSDYISASCTKCHDEAMDLERHRTERMTSRVPVKNPGHEDRPLRIVEGRALFTSVGCINCHNVDGLGDSRRVGPELAHVGEKLDTGFMHRWIWYPNEFRPSTRMPHFFKQENNLSPSKNEYDPDPILRTETEVSAITHYLKTFSTPYDPHEVPESLTGDAVRGEDLFVSVGCMACHANLDAKDPQDGAGRKLGEVWITNELQRIDGMSSDEAKSRFGAMSKNERVHFAMRRFEPARREKAFARRQAEEIAADNEEREPDEGKMYVPPSFTRFAPELSGLGTKLVPDAEDEEQRARGRRWLYNWLRDPRHFSTTSMMPQLFKDNYYWKIEPGERDGQRDQDILDIAEYLLGLRNDDFETTPFVDDDEHHAEAQRLIRMLLSGQNTAGVTEKILNDESGASGRPYGRLSAAIVQQTFKSFGGGDEGKQRVVEMIADQDVRGRQKLFLGMKMISHYGCYACHVIPGFEDATRPGTDQTGWGQKFITQLDFAFYSPPFHHDIEEQEDVFGSLYRTDGEYGEVGGHLIRDIDDSVGDDHLEAGTDILHNHASFAYYKLRNPRIWDRAKIKRPYDKLKMPNFFFTDEEARSLTTFLLSRRDPWVSEKVTVEYEGAPAGKIAKGRALVRELNCIGCHAIEANTANLHQFFSQDIQMDDQTPIHPRFMPPLLWGEGAKVNGPWLHGFLANVEMLRPWLNVRMPSFSLTNEERTTLVEYFVGLVQDESLVLRSELNPIREYIANAHSGLGGGGDSDGNDAVGADWFMSGDLVDAADFLSRWAVEHKQIRPTALNTYGETDEQAIFENTTKPVFKRVLDRSTFLSDLFGVEYPFPRDVAPDIDDARFKLGEALFYNQRCLACHVGGDPSVPGTTRDIKAPNFALSHERLRYDWVLKWIQDPQAIQPGANMPQIAFAGLPDELRQQLVTAAGTDTTDQLRALVDFVFAMGDRRYTAIQPGAAEAEAEAAAGDKAKEGEEEDFDFDSDEPEAEEEDFDF